eukprot:g19782.t1
MDGVTNFTTNSVNVAIVVDGSGSIYPEDWEKEQTFAKQAVAAFARRNIFENGGSASYVQFTSLPLDMGTFYSEEDFDAHVDDVVQFGGGTDIVNGIQGGAELMDASPASFNIMILITDGQHSDGYGGDPAATAAEIRADGRTTIFVVAVGDGLQYGTGFSDEVEGIAGDPDNVFSIEGFDALEAVLDEIELSAESSLSCSATNVEISIEFSVPVSSVESPGAAAVSSVASTGGAITADNRVTFTAADLENNPTMFAVGLEECGNVLLVEYKDDQGNTPDFSTLPEPTCFETTTTAAVAASIAVASAGVLAVLVNIFTVRPTIGIEAPSPPSMVEDSLIPAEPDASRSAVDSGGDSTTENTSGNPGEEKSDNRGGNPSSGGGVADGVDPSSGNPGSTRGLASATDGGYPLESADAPTTHIVIGAAAAAAVALRVGGAGNNRRPSSTLAWLLVLQIQFLAILSLVESVGSDSSWLSSILREMRWYNLWIPIRKDPEPGKDIDEDYFVGNLVIVAFVGLLILLIHLLLVSAVEAYWLQAKESNDVADAEEDQPPPPDYHDVVDQSPPDYNAMVGQSTVTEDPKEKIAQSTDPEDDPKEQIASHRDRSQSIWLYFPHVELVFLLYSVQGSLTTQLTVLRDGDGAMFYAAAIVLALYPVFLIGMMFRVIFVRVFPKSGGVTFITTKTGRQSFCSRVAKGVKEEHSVFAWAKKGVWITADTEDAMKRRLIDWFRIGFEPLFADYTQSGSWFAVYTLLESYVSTGVAVFLDSNSQWQLYALLGLSTVGCLLLLCLRPFANRMVDAIAVFRQGINAISLGLLIIANLEFGNPYAEVMETVAGIAAFALLVFGLAAPVIVEGLVVLIKAVQRTTAICCGGREQSSKGARRSEGCCNLLLRWVRAWFVTIGLNFAAYRKDFANGLRRKPHSE